MKAPTHYEILGVAPDATPAQIKTAYRQAAKKHHPDRHTDELVKREATRQMQQINLAHDVLKDALQRQKYDQRLTNPPLAKTPAAPTSKSPPTPHRRAPASSPWQRANPRQHEPRPAPPPAPAPLRNPDREWVSAQRFERASVAVQAHFDNLIRRYPDQKAKLLATLRWQLTKQDAAIRKGREVGQSEAASLARWVQGAKKAGNNRVETPASGPRDPNRPQPKASPQTPLDEEVVTQVTAYFDELTTQNPLDKGPLRAALDWQLKRKKAEVAHLLRVGLSEARALARWASEARLAADKQIKKR